MKEKFGNKRMKYTRYEEVKDEVPRNDGDYNRRKAEGASFTYD